MMQKENQVLRACLDYLTMRGIECWRNNTGAMTIPGTKRFVRFGKPGVPDILGYLDDGRFLAVECKSAIGRLSPAQVAFLERAERCGCKVVVARSIDDLQKAGL